MKNMKKIYVIAAMMLVTMPLAAQETYENAKIAQEDLNGTARYVGMGGAMEALGADLSTISTNPAGIGLFRKSNVNISFGLVSQDNAKSVMGGNKTNMSFDQAGFVYSSRTGKTSYLNLAFNFHKSRNFNMILSAAAPLQNASLNKLTYDKGINELVYPQQKGVDLFVRDAEGRVVGYNHQPDFSQYPYQSCNQLDDMLANGYNFAGLYDVDTEQKIGDIWTYDNANSYQFDRAHKGYIGVYDFNISGNINNRVYLGITVGLHDVHYKHTSEYTDFMHTAEMTRDYSLTVADSREITGTGFDVKAGIIFRPVETSPFRIGLSVSTPTFYELRTSNTTTIFDSDGNSMSSRNINDANNGRCNYKFKLYTPWKFGASLGHTIGTQVALGLSYEYADYGSMDTRVITGEYYDYWSNSRSTESRSDKVMNDHTEGTLKGVHTLKLGGEYKPVKDVALRLGYNYVSSMYKKDGFKDGSLDSYGTYVASATDFTNWEDTHRITLGAGYTYEKFNVSLAYQYSMTKGTFYPFMSYTDTYVSDCNNIVDGVSVKNNRHQLLLTLGYTF
jgi:hypothetical protein